jgi:hypothetical protein
MACRNGNSRFVTPKDYWHEHGPMGLGIGFDYVLGMYFVSHYTRKEEEKRTACFHAQSPDMKSPNRWSSPWYS